MRNIKILVLIALAVLHIASSRAAMQDIGASLWLMEPYFRSGSPAFNVCSLTISTHKCAMVFRVAKTGSLRTMGILTGTVTTAAAGATIRVETVDNATGNPSGTLFGANTSCGVNVASTDDAVWKSCNLTADASVTRGDLIAVVVTNDASGVWAVQHQMASSTSNHWGSMFPYVAAFGASWTKSGGYPNVGVGYSDGSYSSIPGVYSARSVVETGYNTGSTPDEIGNKFTPTVTFKVSGIWASAPGGGDAELIIYDSSDTALCTITADKDNLFSNVDALGYVAMCPSEVTISANQTYRVVMKPTSATNTFYEGFTVESSALMGAFPLGTVMHRTERTNAGAWTDTATARGFIGLIVSGIDDGASVGGNGGIIGD